MAVFSATQRVALRFTQCLRRGALQAILLSACAAAFGLTLPVQAQDRLSYTVAVLPDSPPMSMRNEQGKLVGFNIDYATQLCAELARPCVFKEIYLDQVLDAVHRGDADFAVVALVRSPERERKVIFTRPYYRGNMFWVSATPSAPPSAGARVLTITGSRQLAYLEQHRGQSWQLVTRQTHREVLTSLLRGDADAALLPLATTAYLFSSPDFLALRWYTQPINDPHMDNSACMVVNPNLPQLRDALNEAIIKLNANGQFSRLNSRYFPFRID